MYSEYLDFVENKFETFFKENHYQKEEPVNITSQVDPTVDFVGSKISPLKHYVLEDSIGESGRFLIQNCMKLKSMKYLKTEIPQVFGSYYKCMGTLTEPKPEKMVADLFAFLTGKEYLGILPQDICIRINSADTDLVHAIAGVDPRIVRYVNTVEEKHYRHKYGMKDPLITGRDFNVGIRKRGTGDFFNCATLVIMEAEEKKLAIDMGMSNLSLAMCYFGTDSTLECARIADLMPVKSVEEIKFADALTAVAALLKEDILQHPSKHFQKKFRQYMHALALWKNRLGYSEEAVTTLICEYLEKEYAQDFSAKYEEWLRVIQKGGRLYA